MKSRQVDLILRKHGLEQGTAHILTNIVERQNDLERSIKELAEMQGKLIDTINNVVVGSLGMKEEMIRRLKKAGLNEPEDDLDSETIQ